MQYRNRIRLFWFFSFLVIILVFILFQSFFYDYWFFILMYDLSLFLLLKAVLYKSDSSCFLSLLLLTLLSFLLIINLNNLSHIFIIPFVFASISITSILTFLFFNKKGMLKLFFITIIIFIFSICFTFNLINFTIFIVLLSASTVFGIAYYKYY